jgi:type II restriction/modification system DNA methylase subunit YeeA
MIMNKAKLKSYAPQARLDFIAAVTTRANLLGLSEKAGQLEVAPVQTQGDVALIAGQAWPAKVATQREQLIVRMRREGFAQTCEAVAYTWFNRIAALRYMELHDYLGHGHRALSSAEGGLPDILTYASDLAHAGDSGLPGLKAELVTEMKLAGNRDSELYRMLLVAQCNALSRTMPFLFERIDDDSELLLPDHLLRSDSVIAKLVEQIPEEDWAEVEIIGWLYQFYISDKKDQVIGKVVKSEDIPAATQLFTPNWIVQYLVQNSVGRLWLTANPQSTLGKDWPYYIKPAEQTPKVQAQLNALIQARVSEDGDTLNPESITVLDPACGSGHILVVAYDVLRSIYLERGYQPRAIPRLILEKNLFGLDIDDRAAQMAGFALLMKARADDRRLFDGPMKLNVLSLKESKGLDASILAPTLQTIAYSIDLKSDVGAIGNEFVAQDLFPESKLQTSLGETTPLSIKNTELKSTITTLITTFVNAKTFGSLITVSEQLRTKILWLQEIISLAIKRGDLYENSAAQDLMPLVAQAQILSMQFDVVVANPPYMGSKGMNSLVKQFARSLFPAGKPDMFAMFMERCLGFGNQTSEMGFVTPYVWMFISSYEEIREKFVSEATIQTLVQLEYNAFEPACVPVCAFVLSKESIPEYLGSYIKLSDFRGHEAQAPKTLEAISNPECGWFFTARPNDFKKIPGSPIVYWSSEIMGALFESSTNIDALSEFTGSQNITGDNNKYLRMFWEIDFLRFRGDWVPYSKGGSYRKWYGNMEYVVNWSDAGRLFYKSNPTSNMLNQKYWFREGICYSDLTSGDYSARYLPKGCIYDKKGPAFHLPRESLGWVQSVLNTPIGTYIFKMLNPTLTLQVREVKMFPLIEPKIEWLSIINANHEQLIRSAIADWDSIETSWDFSRNPLIDFKKSTLCQTYFDLECAINKRIIETKKLEEQNNEIFINTYGLQEELSPLVPDEKITLSRANREKDCQRLISYALGCMMGRYSLDHPGLIYAHAGNKGFDPTCYNSFPADADGIVPITDELWFDEDASSRIREFLRAVWGPDTLEENMAWLAESLGAKPDETSDETIRRYISGKFYKDHIQTYKKRPIYWLFSSGKQGAFHALVYLHRYNEGTLARMRAEYVVPLTSKIQSRIEMLEKDVNASSSTAARNKLTKEVEKLKKKHVELLAYDEQLRHYADMRITLDLDDGVKVNYGKFHMY